MSRINLKYCTIKIKDGGSNELEVKVGEGNATWSEKKNREYYLDRGVLDTVRDGDDVPVELKLDFTWEFLTASMGSGTPTVEDALKQRGEANTWETSSSDACEPYAVDIEITYTPPCIDEDKEVWLFSDFRYEQLDHDFKAASVSVSGKCNVTEPSDSRTAAS